MLNILDLSPLVPQPKTSKLSLTLDQATYGFLQANAALCLALYMIDTIHQKVQPTRKMELNSKLFMEVETLLDISVMMLFPWVELLSPMLLLPKLLKKVVCHS